MIRMLWNVTHTHSQFSYVVHELLFNGEEPSVAADVPPGSSDEFDVRSASECIGRDIRCDAHGYWRRIVHIEPRGRWGAIVDAGPIQHRGKPPDSATRTSI